MTLLGAAAAAALIAVGAAGPAVAAGPTDPAVRVLVQKATLDDPHALAATHAELALAASRACDQLMQHYVHDRIQMRACIMQTLDAAVADANAPQLTALHARLPINVRYRIRAEGERRQVALAVLD